MEERIAQLEKELAELKNNFYKDNFVSSQIFRKDTSFTGKIGFFTKSGVSQQSAISAPSNAGPTYDQTVAQSTVDKVNSIRTVLQNLGFIA